MVKWRMRHYNWDPALTDVFISTESFSDPRLAPILGRILSLYS